MKLTQTQLDYLAAQDWKEAMPFSSATQPLMIDGAATEYTKTYTIMETSRGDRLIIREEK